MNGWNKGMIVGLLLVVPSFVAAERGDVQKVDLSRRNTEFSERQVPIRTHELKRNDRLTTQRIPIKEWHTEFNPIGQRRSSIQVRERSEKRMISPQVIEMNKLESPLAGQSGRMAYVRNFDQVRENQLVPKYRDADVVTVKEMSVPAETKRDKELSMRELNRFSFQRNHASEGTPTVQRTSDNDS